MSAANRAATALVTTHLGSHVALAQRHHKAEAIFAAKRAARDTVQDQVAARRRANAVAKAAAAHAKRETTARRVEAAVNLRISLEQQRQDCLRGTSENAEVVCER